MRTKPLCKKDTNESSLTLEIWDDEVDSKDKEVSVSTENESSLNESVQCDDFLFTIDKQPNVKNDLDIPTYGQVTFSLFFFIFISFFFSFIILYIYIIVNVLLQSEEILHHSLIYLSL